MTIEIALVISGISLAFGIYQGISTMRRNAKCDDKNDATQLTTVIVKLENIAAQVAALTTGLIWKAAVATYNDIATTYATPLENWTVTCLDTGYVYQYDGTVWNLILASLATAATTAEVQEVLEVVS